MVTYPNSPHCYITIEYDSWLHALGIGYYNALKSEATLYNNLN